jgi:hypothetical protein
MLILSPCATHWVLHISFGLLTHKINTPNSQLTQRPQIAPIPPRSCRNIHVTIYFKYDRITIRAIPLSIIHGLHGLHGIQASYLSEMVKAPKMSLGKQDGQPMLLIISS